MGLFKSINKAIGSLPGADKGLWGTYAEGAEDYKTALKRAGLPDTATKEQLTTANLFKNLSREQQKDLLLNNPNIYTPEGSQTYNPLTNSVTLGESDFTKNQRLGQEALASQLVGSLSGNLPSSNAEIQDATFNRGKALIDPIVKQQRRDLAQQLADQGIPAGSEGYTEAMNRLDDSIARQFTDLSQASIATAETQRAQRFNEIASLLGKSQVGSGASFSQTQPQFSGLDLFGAEQAKLNRDFQQSQLSRQLSQSNRNAIYGAIGGLGSAGITAASDRRLKKNIKSIGTSPNGISIYEFDYINPEHGEGTYQGVMAQELVKTNPEAVLSDLEGSLSVDYSKIDVEFRRVK